MTGGHPLLEVTDLRTRIKEADVVDGVSLTVGRGETVGLVGESGSGKTLTALSVVGLLPRAARVVGGRVALDGQDLLALTDKRRRAMLADDVGVIFQNPTVALNPRLTVGAQLREALPAGLRRDRAGARRRVVELLDQVGIARGAERLTAYPHEFSGGLNQRIMIAIAIARSPRLLVADEPTTALDVSVQAQVLDLLDTLRADLGLGVLLVTHDVGVVADRADRVAVMHAGRIVEQATTAEVLERPAHERTRSLLANVPRLDDPAPPPVAAGGRPVLEVRGAVRQFRSGGGAPIRAVDGVDLVLHPGQALGLVGESGSGKTTLARLVVGLDRPTEGTVLHDGDDPHTLDGAGRARWRRRVQYVFQDPYGSLDPRLTVDRIIGEPIELSGTPAERRARRERIEELLAEVDLPASFAARRPDQLSGGQRQRVAIARALALDPTLVVADEPVSALDLSVQATILALLRRLRETRGLTYVVISHDLAVIKGLCTDVAVMQGGRIVERGPTEEVLGRPEHPYTASLLAAVPGRRLAGPAVVPTSA
ncbi:dipeptide ABC transporter ATP-binding protein [Pseudonocardia lutea]|uniref:Dipeptide ABC transporter ATP-binding protein n=1 Tax=Pseudonocardia lutea TaxID=2172015 RepID=A0ABW1IDT7_9PSEU